MPSKRWWTTGGPIPAQRLVCFVNPRGVAGLSIHRSLYIGKSEEVSLPGGRDEGKIIICCSEGDHCVII